MTLFSTRTACALLLAASLAACGGGGSDKATFPVAGTVTGLVYSGLKLETGSQTVDVAPNAANTATTINLVNYTFPQVLGYGDVYLIKIAANPAHQTCSFPSYRQQADSAGHTATINVALTCAINGYSLNGYVYGLKGDGLQLINGSDYGTITLTKAIVDANAATEAAAKAAAAAATPPTTSYTLTPSFSFADPNKLVAYNQTYGVTVLTQPPGQTCTVTNGNGVMQDAAVVNITVNCVDNPT